MGGGASQVSQILHDSDTILLVVRAGSNTRIERYDRAEDAFVSQGPNMGLAHPRGFIRDGVVALAGIEGVQIRVLFTDFDGSLTTLGGLATRTLHQGSAPISQVALLNLGGETALAFLEGESGATRLYLARLTSDWEATDLRAVSSEGEAATHFDALAQPDGSVALAWLSTRSIPDPEDAEGPEVTERSIDFARICP